MTEQESYEPGRAALPDPHPTSELPELDTGTGWPGREAAPVPHPRATVDDDNDDVVRGRTRRGGCLFFLAGLAALLIVIALGAKIAGFWPHLRNPFGSEKVDRSQPTLLLSIRNLARFEAASGNFQVIIDLQKDRAHIPDILVNERTLFVAVGTVDAYVDFSQIATGDIKDSPDHKSVEVDLPAAQLEPARIDHDRSYVFAEQRGLWNRIVGFIDDDPNKMQQLYKYGVQKIEDAARDSGLAQRAADNTRKMLEQLLRSLGYTSVLINIANP